jgi:oxygen-independent coproporphyrinogen-3 oxidase
MAKVAKERSNESKNLSFYIHIPYCAKRCGYCDFNTYTPSELNLPNNALVYTRYIDAALREIDLASKTLGGCEIQSIFFGGGTPSLIPGLEIARVIKSIEERFQLVKDVEITLEANPDSIGKEFLEKIRSSGVNRISMGMQSAQRHVLEALDRTHKPENVLNGCDLIRSVGFDYLSVDLIYGAPGESLEDWEVSYKTALSLPIDHISAYALIVESGTKLAAEVKRGEKNLPPEDETAEKYLAFDRAAVSNGFDWYELSNWAKPGCSSKHNQAYWRGANWWGIGPGAHSHVSGRRWWNVKHPNKYQELLFNSKSPELDSEVLTLENQRDEFFMLNIRTREGIDLAEFDESQMKIATKYRDSGHIDTEEWRDSRLVLTAQGRLIADRIVRELLL